MLRRFYGASPASLGPHEEAAMTQLARAHLRLNDEDTPPEAQVAEGQSFLSCLEVAANELGIKAADRSYRNSFSANYRALFPDQIRRYRMDVLEASADQHAAIWVNGDKFELSGEAVGHAERLQLAWASLHEMLDKWCAAPVQQARPTRQKLGALLEELDAAWARFEQSYVHELIAIENQARQLLLQAVEQEGRVRSCQGTGTGLRDAQRELVGSIARLNAVANFKRKGRDDLDAEILFRGQDVLSLKAAVMGAGDPGRKAAQLLASDVVGAFEAMCKYLREAARCIERVDPHLCNNAGLVSRLVDWEESWEVGARFVRDPAMLGALCDNVRELSVAQSIAPALTTMVGDYDAELFMVLPRLLCLAFAAGPSRPRAALLQELLGHRWAEPAGGQKEMGPELRALVDEYGAAVELLGATCAANHGSAAASSAKEALVRRAVAGASACKERVEVVERLMRTLEGWSVELQRHCPEDWNQCSAVLMHCLTEQDRLERQASLFQV